MYDICYTKSTEDRIAYIEYIDEMYNAEALTAHLKEVVNIIGARILNIAVQDYEPQGASVTLLICDEGGCGHVVRGRTLPRIWTKAILPSIPIRNIIPTVGFAPSGQILMFLPVGRLRRFRP